MVDKHIMELEMVAAIMQSLCGQDGFDDWMDINCDHFDGSLGLARSVITVAKDVVEMELATGDTETYLYEIADWIGDFYRQNANEPSHHALSEALNRIFRERDARDQTTLDALMDGGRRH